MTAFEKTKKRPEDKRKRHLNDAPEDIEGFIGPWGKFVDEQTVMKPNKVWLFHNINILGKYICFACVQVILIGYYTVQYQNIFGQEPSYFTSIV